MTAHKSLRISPTTRRWLSLLPSTRTYSLLRRHYYSTTLSYHISTKKGLVGASISEPGSEVNHGLSFLINIIFYSYYDEIVAE